jgi:hypothetical protein
MGWLENHPKSTEIQQVSCGALTIAHIGLGKSRPGLNARFFEQDSQGTKSGK